MAEQEQTNTNPPVSINTPTRTSTRGFASMDREKQREIARKGGRAAHLKGTAHEFTSDEARAAGRKGGETVSRDRAHMAAIGREGGQARGARAALRLQEMRAQRSGTELQQPSRQEGTDRDFKKTG
jgi:general stress protein YciG